MWRYLWNGAAALIRILLVDDHTLVRTGISLLLESSKKIKVVGEAESSEEAVRMTYQLLPDIVIMDLSFPEGRNGFSAIREIRGQFPEIGIVVLSMYEDLQYVQQAAMLGVKGYLLKNGDRDLLIRAVTTVHRGEACFATHIPQEMIEGWMSAAPIKDTLLSAREEEIVRMTALGYTNREISAMLHISSKTVENHKYKAMGKLNVKTKQQLMKYALNNLLELSK